MKLLYQHPEGGRILFSQRYGRLVLSEPLNHDDIASTGVTIGPEGLRQLAADLYAIAAGIEHKTTIDAVKRQMTDLLEYIEEEYDGCEYVQSIVRDYALSALGAVGDDQEAEQ